MKRYSRRDLYALGEPLGESATYKKADGGLILGDGGGGGSSAPATQTQVADLPDWARPYAQETLEKTRALTASPYQAYDQPRIAGFSPLQLQAQERAASMTASPQIGTATGMATAAGLAGLGAGYQPGYFANQFQAPGEYRPGFFGVQGVTAPQLQQYQMGPAERVSGGEYTAPMMATAQTGFRPDLQTFQMGPAERAQTQSFVQPGAAEAYMSPFMESVIGRQTREAERQAGLAARQRRAQAIQQGAFGGTRGAITEAAAARDLEQLKSDIYGAGQQTAFQQAQQQFNQEQQARLQAQLANQQAGLTVGGQNLAAALGVQQLGTQTGLQTALANLSAQQQANVQNQAAQLQTQGLSAGQAMQAALANQQAGLTTGQQNLAALLGIQQFGAGQNLQAQLANQAAAQQAQAQREASRQFGYGQRMQAAGLGAQYGQAAQQLAEQSRQFGAGIGMQGLGVGLQAAGQLGQLGQQAFGQEMDINRLQQQVGAQQQALRQQGLTQAYQDFLNEQNYPYKQLGYMSDMIRGLPLGQQSVRQIYEPPGSIAGQLGGIGMGLYGLGQMGVRFNEGGQVDGYAEGGGVDDPDNVAKIVGGLSDAQLAQAKRAAQARGDFEQLQAITVEEGMRASERSGLAGAFNQLPYDRQEEMMAGGGIVAFSDGGDSSYDVLERKRLEQPRSAPKPRPAPSRRAAPVSPEIHQGINQIAEQTGQSRESLQSIFDSYRNALKEESTASMKELSDLAEKSMGGSKAVKEQALGRALAEFGFKWAASAAKPRAKFLSSAAEAAPALAASVAESDKIAREMDQNDARMRMTMKQFEIAQRKGDLATASQLAGQERALMQSQEQLGLQRQQLEETKRANIAREGIQRTRGAGGGNAAMRAYMTGQSKAQDRAARLFKDTWGDYATRQQLISQGFKTGDQYYEHLVKREMKRAVPIYGVTPAAADEED